MILKKNVTAIILAAGNSERFGKKRNKNFELINGKSVLSYSLNAFDKNIYIDNIIVVIKENELEKVKKIIDSESLEKNINIVIGGSTRKESVYNSLEQINSDIVIIHDGARPLIRQEYIINCCESMEKYVGVTIGVKSKDTVKITDKNNIVISSTYRELTWNIQTPQCFDRKILLKMHEKYKNENTYDDCALLEKGGYLVKVIPGHYSNIKITTAEDLDIIKNWIKKLP